MPKNFREWREAAMQINAQSQSDGKTEPIPDASKLRKKPLAKQVIQHNLDQGFSNAK